VRDGLKTASGGSQLFKPSSTASTKFSRGQVTMRSGPAAPPTDSQLVFQNTQKCKFYKATENDAVPLQQTYQMFLPNKIKKGTSYTQNHDFAKPNKDSTGKILPNSIPQLKEILKNMMP
jgi:hypothetical protein